MKRDANISSNAAAEQVQFFFIMHFVIILQCWNSFDNSWVTVYRDWSDVAW